MLFKTHIENIDQIKQCIEIFDRCFFHGDGNMFSTKSDSDFHKNYSNPTSEGAKYAIEFKSADQVPDSVEGLNEKLMKAKNQEMMEQALPASTSGVKTMPQRKAGSEAANLAVKRSSDQEKTDGPVELTDDQKLEKMIKDEEKDKTKSGPIAGSEAV